MIDASYTEKVSESFLRDMKHPAIQFALYRSFKKWTIMRDQLIEVYVQKTNLPHEFFTDALDGELAIAMVG